MEIRVHGRGGQGGVTCAKILATLYARLGKTVQTFGDYAGERSGAPVRAYARVGDGPITNRNKVYEPDHMLVLDPTLLNQALVAGLQPGGLLIINTPRAPEEFKDEFPGYRIVTVDATGIARRHHIGTRSVVIVNTTITGAWVRALELPMAELEEAYRGMGFHGNFPAAQEAYEAARIREIPEGEHVATVEGSAASAWGQTAEGAIPGIEEHLEAPPTPLKTGSWRSQMPTYAGHLAPCNANCPAGNNVVEFLQALARGDGEEAAAAILGQSSPLPGTCGRVCPAFCMQGCNRREHDEAVNVRELERWVADHVKVAREAKRTPKTVRRIAIVGGGPAGLTAAYALALEGHQPIIHEGERELGGVLHTGIPTFRLPREVLEKEVQGIVDLGVEWHGGQFVSAAMLQELAETHDAVIVATGLQDLRGLRVPGADLPGVEQGIHFLHRVNVGSGDPALSGHVIVLGGGNTAMDCARSALRAGAEKVTVAYRRTPAEMPAIPGEVEEAREEGVVFLFQRSPVGFVGPDRVTAIQLAEVEMGEPDESGRRRPVVTDRVQELPCSAVLLALGQSADLSLLPEGWELQDGRVHAGGKELPVWVAGDVHRGDGTVTHAIGDGRRTALRALHALGEDVVVPVPPARVGIVTPADIRYHRFAHISQCHGSHEPAAERIRHFQEVNHGLQDVTESGRCLACGYCTECDTCLVYCPEGVITHKEGGGYEVNLEYCKGCGICVVECPRKGMEMIEG